MKTTSIVLSASILFAVPFGALAQPRPAYDSSDVDSSNDSLEYCTLLMQQAKLRSDLLIKGSVGVSINVDASIEKNVSAGYSYNLIGRNVSEILFDIARSECSARSQSKMAESVFMDVDSRIEAAVLQVKIPKLREVILSVNREIAVEKTKINSKIATINDLRALLDFRDQVTASLDQAEQLMVKLNRFPKITFLPANHFIDRAESDTVKALMLRSKIEAVGSESMVLGAGVRQGVDSKRASGYVAFSYSYNLGSFGADRSLATMGDTAKRAQREAKEGLSQRFRIAKSEISGYLHTLKEVESHLKMKLDEVASIQTKISASSSSLAVKNMRVLDLERSLLEVELDAAQKRAALAGRWLDAQDLILSSEKKFP